MGIEFFTIEGKRVMKSTDLYPLLGVSMLQYSRWTRFNIIDHGVKDFDYFLADKEHLKRSALGGRRSEVYYVTLDFAKALCLVVKTRAAKRTRLWLYTV